MEKPSKSSLGIASLPIIIVIVLVLSAGGYFAYTNYGSELGLRPPAEEGETPRRIGLPSPSPTAEEDLGTPSPIKQGVETYNISQSSVARPKIYQATLDPHEPAEGETQSLTIRVRDEVPVNSVTVTLETDNSSRQIPVEFTNGTNLDGTWEGSWVVDDSLLRTYILTINASGAGGTSSVEVGIRRP